MDESATVEERILVKAESLFLQYGIRSVTMDDISRALSISKKTIYQHFRDKDNIVLRVAERVFDKEKQTMYHIHHQGKDVVHEMVQISKYLREHVASINLSVMYDLQKFYKDAWDVFLVFKQQCLTLIEAVINRGIEEGNFRSDIDARVLAVFRTETISMCFDQQLFPREHFDPRGVQAQLFEHFINGILTDQGRDLYLQYSKIEVSL